MCYLSFEEDSGVIFGFKEILGDIYQLGIMKSLVFYEFSCGVGWL